MSIQSKLPRWQSHKVVNAAKITAVEDDGTMVLNASDNGRAIKVRPAERMFARYRPVPGDYYVIYEDGYASISPAATFESGYHML
jgi:hypothetical protein